MPQLVRQSEAATTDLIVAINQRNSAVGKQHSSCVRDVYSKIASERPEPNVGHSPGQIMQRFRVVERKNLANLFRKLLSVFI
ncbi:hypothetical protein L603_001700000540 [Cellulosimicrobium cellulans J34]|nr:hypothetical protein L603_001700000540 [Cellulosimicrobium cellulans J34]SMF28645.1 hypothetical protein SAMN02744115_02452 [Cellulosimicrobium cellulans J1]